MSMSTPDYNLRRNRDRLILAALDRTRGDKSAAAKLLGIDRTSLHRMLAKMDGVLKTSREGRF